MGVLRLLPPAVHTALTCFAISSPLVAVYLGCLPRGKAPTLLNIDCWWCVFLARRSPRYAAAIRHPHPSVRPLVSPVSDTTAGPVAPAG